MDNNYIRSHLEILKRKMKTDIENYRCARTNSLFTTSDIEAVEESVVILKTLEEEITSLKDTIQKLKTKKTRKRKKKEKK